MTPLSTRARRGIILIAAICFIIIAPLVLANSFGYKITQIDDIFDYVKTGGIYLHSDINSASIYIDDEYFKDNGLLLRNVLIPELTPGETYKVVVIKDGFQDWRKELLVLPSLVTEARVYMLPEVIESLAIYPYKDQLGVGTTTPPTVPFSGTSTLTNETYLDSVVLFTEEEIVPVIPVVATSTATTTKDIPEYFTDLGVEDPDELDNLIILSDQVVWLEDGNVTIHWVDENKTIPYYYCLIRDECRTQITVDWEEEILSFEFLPGRDDVILVLVSGGIYTAEFDDRSQPNIQTVYLGENLDFRKNEQNNIVVKDGEIFYELDL